jgi:hypothetical protein
MTCRFGPEASFFIDAGGRPAPELSCLQQQQQQHLQQQQQRITQCEVWSCDDQYEPTEEERKLKGSVGRAMDNSEAVKFLQQVTLFLAV